MLALTLGIAAGSTAYALTQYEATEIEKKAIEFAIDVDYKPPESFVGRLAYRNHYRCGAANSQMGRQGGTTDWLLAGRVDSLTEIGVSGLADIVDYRPRSTGWKAG